MMKKCSVDDLIVLQKISCDTYQKTFASMNTEANMKAYLDEAYHLDKLKKELENEASAFYFLYQDEKLAGYLKLNESDAQTEIHDPASLEIERIYVQSGFQRAGVGCRLMNYAIEVARKKKKTYLWLGVWEKNQKALKFYKKNGFYPIGLHTFVMGDEAQRDYLLRKDL